jgi:hypothetical protein
MNRLTQIGIQVGTDKATHHEFTEQYERVFSLYESPRILEIGIADFKSIDMYLKYFNNPYIVGMDIESKLHFCNDSWRFVQGDQTNIKDLSKCVEGEDLFDIILDDGGHTMKQQQVTFGYLIDYVKPGGYYILEDLHTSLNTQYIEHDCEVSSLEMLQKIKAGEVYFSNYISREQQANLISKIEYIEILPKNSENLYDSVTSIIKIKS